MQYRHRFRQVIQLCLACLPGLFIFPANAASLDASWSSGEYKARATSGKAWSEARSAIRMDRGWIFARNDAKNLYLFVDVTGDVTKDTPKRQHPWGDFISLTFDIDRNGKMTRNRDLQYSQRSGTYRLMLRRVSDQLRFADHRPTQAKLYPGFTGTLNLRRQHRVWEFVIPLEELSAKPGGKLKFGISVHSEQPAFSDSLPSNYLREFGKFVDLKLATNPLIFHMVDMRAFPRRVGIIDRVVIKPDFSKFRPQGNLTLVPPTPETCPLPKGDPVKRAILPDGRIELSYRNGSKKRQVENGWEYVCPDGRVLSATIVMKSTAAPPTLDPTEDPSGANHGELLNSHASGLLFIIGALVDYDQAMVENYLDTEEEGWDIVEQISERGKFISYLLAE